MSAGRIGRPDLHALGVTSVAKKSNPSTIIQKVTLAQKVGVKFFLSFLIPSTMSAMLSSPL